MREGIRRLGLAVAWISWAWLAGVAVFAFYREWNDREVGNWLDEFLFNGLLALPAILGLILAWVLEGFAKSDAPHPPPPRRVENDPDASGDGS